MKIIAYIDDLMPALEATLIEYSIGEQDPKIVSATNSDCRRALFPFSREYNTQLFVIESDQAITRYKRFVLFAIWMMTLNEHNKTDERNQFYGKEILSKNENALIADYRMDNTDWVQILLLPNDGDIKVLKSVFCVLASSGDNSQCCSAVMLGKEGLKDRLAQNIQNTAPYANVSSALVRIIEPLPPIKEEVSNVEGTIDDNRIVQNISEFVGCTFEYGVDDSREKSYKTEGTTDQKSVQSIDEKMHDR